MAGLRAESSRRDPSGVPMIQQPTPTPTSTPTMPSSSIEEKSNVSSKGLILVLPTGKLMAAILPERIMRVPRMEWQWSLNPGPFNMKEHVLISMFANCGYSAGGGDAYPTGAITVMKAYYKESISFFAALIIVLITQIIGYGWVGLLRKYLVQPAEMWWPSNLA